MNERKKKTLRICKICAIVLAIVAVLTLLIVFIVGTSLKNSDTIFPNVCVMGVNVGDMTKEEAVQALEEGIEKTQNDRTLTVELEDRKLVFEQDKTNAAPDPELMAEKAFSYGREGGAFHAVSVYLECDQSAYIIDAEDLVQIDTSYIRKTIVETAEDVRQELVQSKISMDEENQILTITLGYNGRSLNVDKLYETVIGAYTKGDLSTISFAYDIVPYDIVDLQPYYDKYCTPARNAYYNKAEDRLMPEVVGYGFDLIAVNAQIALAPEGSVLEIPLEVMEPTVTMEEYNNKNFPDVLSSYRSAHTYDNNRTMNLKLACQSIDGTVLQPGEVFSFNNVVGERTAEKGYKEGIIYADGGKSELEAGGGICQIVSSVYMCALTADLQIVERQPHMYPVSYVKPGCDATVYWGAVDFKFKNTNSTPIKINASVSGGYVDISFVGTKEHDYSISMTSQLVETIPYEEVETVDPSKPVGYREQTQAPHTGYVYWSYKNYYDANGAYLRTEKCAISEYSKYDAEYIVGPDTGEEEPEEEEPEEKEPEEKEPSGSSSNRQPDREEEREDPVDWQDSTGNGPGINTGRDRVNYRQ